MRRVIVVGAGPAGASLAFVLADRGIAVTLLERQDDFAREFRGEVLLASGIEALEQLGLRGVFEATPRAAPRVFEAYLNRRRVVRAEADAALFAGRLPTPLSQPALLEGIVAEAAKRPSFRFLRGATVADLVRDGGRVVGVRVSQGDRESELSADLVVGADGRASVVRRRGGFEAIAQDLPMDVLWCKVPSLDAIQGLRAYLGGGHLLIAYRAWDDRLQVGWVILKGAFAELHRRGVEAWVEEMSRHVSDDLAEHLRASGSDLGHHFLLYCRADRVTRWSAPGVLLLGDAAHTMSPVGGQGINIALRDVIVAANELVPVLRQDGSPEALDAACARIQAEREPEVRAIQRLQDLGRVGPGPLPAQLQGLPMEAGRLAVEAQVPIHASHGVQQRGANLGLVLELRLDPARSRVEHFPRRHRVAPRLVRVRHLEQVHEEGRHLLGLGALALDPP